MLLPWLLIAAALTSDQEAADKQALSTQLVYCSSAACKVSVIAVCIYDLIMTPYRCRPHERPGSSAQTSFVAATYQSVRFSRSLATRFHAGHSHLLTCVCPLKWVGGKRACMLVVGTHDIALRTLECLGVAISSFCDQQHFKINFFPFKVYIYLRNEILVLSIQKWCCSRPVLLFERQKRQSFSCF